MTEEMDEVVEATGFSGVDKCFNCGEEDSMTKEYETKEGIRISLCDDCCGE